VGDCWRVAVWRVAVAMTVYGVAGAESTRAASPGNPEKFAKGTRMCHQVRCAMLKRGDGENYIATTTTSDSSSKNTLLAYSS
jgi:hypothetical protein